MGTVDWQMKRWNDTLWNRALYAANCILAVFLGLTHCPRAVGSILASKNTLDPSWNVDTYLAVAHHVTFGRSYIWTYGPLGFTDFILTFDPHLAAIATFIQVALASLLAMLIVFVLTSRLHLPPAGVTLAVLALFVAPYFAVGNNEWTAPLCGVIFLYIAFPSGIAVCTPLEDKVRNRYLIATACGGALLAIGPLVKGSLVPATFLTILIWSVNACFGRAWRALAALVLSFLIVWFCVFALVGSGIASGIFWPIAEIQILSGYSAAMGLPASPSYLGLAVILGALALISGSMALWVRRDQWWFIVSVALLWATAFKEGFVRGGGRVFVGFFSLAPWFALLLWWPSQDAGAPIRSDRLIWMRRGATASTIVSCTLSLLIFAQFLPISLPSLSGMTVTLSSQKYLKQRAPIILPSALEAIVTIHKLVGLITSPQQQASLAIQEKAGVTGRPGLAPLVPLLLGHDAFAWPWDGNAIVAAGAHQKFPPIPQEYAAYTKSLDHMDAKFFSSPGRPLLGLVSVEAIDGRLPLQTAGASFVQLLACYQPVALSGTFLLVESRAPTSSVCATDSRHLTPLTPWRQGTLKQWISVPSTPDQITLMQIRMRMSSLGTLMNWFFRPASVSLKMRLSHGTTQSFRVIHATLPHGILVSTVLSSTVGLAELWLGAPNASVKTVALRTKRPMQWAASFSYRFVQLRVPPPDATSRRRHGFDHLHDFVPQLRIFNMISAPVALRHLITHDARASRAWALLSTIYTERADLQQAFPKDSSDFPCTLLEWARTYGVTIDSSAHFLRPYKAMFRSMQTASACQKAINSLAPSS